MLRVRFPLSAKLILGFSLVIVIGVFLSTIIGMRLIGTTIIKQAQDKVRLDLNSAEEVYNGESESVKTKVRLTAIRFFIKDAIRLNETQRLKDELRKVREMEGLDFLNLTDAMGKVIVRTRNPSVKGDRPNDQIVDWVLINKQAVVATNVVSPSELIKEGEDVFVIARIGLVPTPKSRPRVEVEESSGMVIEAAAPVLDYEGRLIGVLYGAKLLNRNYEIVDRVKDIVYKGEKYKNRDIGTATIFLHDYRISTNVMTVDGQRAIGTLVSQEVYDRVIGRGMPWLGRAFVVNAWYMTAYEPLRDIKGNIIGMLYVGMLEAPYVDLRNRVVLIFLGIALLGVILLSIIAYFTTTQISKPIKQLLHATKMVAAGDLTYRVRIKSADEIGELAESFDRMTIALQFATNNYLSCTRTLEKKVEEKSHQLEKAQDQLIQSEKLTSLGKLAAGIGHEINNPLTSILLNSHFVAERIDDDDLKANLQLIIDETARCGSIVRGLLEFARQTPPEKNSSDINDVIEKTMRLFESQIMFTNVNVTKSFAPDLPRLLIDVNKMTQVFTNVILNGLEAMPDGGELAITTRLATDVESIEILFRDTGCGISKGNIGKIFDPFFTTKGTKGTGLGLSVSYGIIQQHHGEIDVASEEGKGTIITIRLPLKEENPLTKESKDE